MKTTANKIRTSALAFGVLVAFVMTIRWIGKPSEVPNVSREVAPSDQQTNRKDKASSQQDKAHQNSPSKPVVNMPLGPQRLRSIANHVYLQLLDSRSLNVDQSVIDLLGINPGQVEELNNSMEHFLTALKVEELHHAYVTQNIDGGEEIVVEPFDRADLLRELRREVEGRLGNDVADFIIEQTAYDTSLAIGNSEMRLSIEHGDDGLDRFVFTQITLRRDALNATTPIQKGSITESPTIPLTIKSLLRKEIDPRFVHLFSAVDTMPHRK